MNFRGFLCLAAAVVLVLSIAAPCGATLGDGQLKERWSQFKAQFRKSYNTATDAKRFESWVNNLNLIEKHNEEAAKGLHSFTLGENEYADLDANEYKVLRGFKPSKPSSRRRRQAGKSTSTYYIATVPPSSLPATVNWTAQGWVNPVQNQGQCGDCWAFSSCGALEGQYYNLTKTSMILSEQNLLDCSQPEGNNGCDGGNMQNAFNYVKINGGIDTYSSYPYTAKLGTTCSYSSANNAATISGWSNVQPNSINALQQAVALVGPISIGFDASLPSFQLYKSGVYAPSNCNPQLLDHAMLAVGYATTSNGTAFWIIKNSWGTSWGMQGYVWVAMAGNVCGVATDPSFPTGLRSTGVTSSSSSNSNSADGSGSGTSNTNGASPPSCRVASLHSIISFIISVAVATLQK